MARAIERLSALQVTKTKKPGYYCDGAGLYLQVAIGGSKSWVLRYTLDGRTRDMGLGSAATFTLAEARERAKDARKLLADKLDPIATRQEAQRERRRAEARALLFSDAASRYIAAHESGWRNAKHAAQWQNTIATYAAPVIGDMDVATIGTDEIMRVLTPIWTIKAETASRLRGRIESVLDWCAVQGHRTGDNPARWKGHLDKLLPARNKVQKVEHHPALPWREIGTFMQALRTMQGTAARAVELIILTACRTSEVLNADWCEIDLAQRTWTIPSERMKAGREHVVPLSDAAMSVLQAQAAAHGMEGYVFPGTRSGKPLSNMAGLALLKRMGRADLTVHGFRSTFRDWAGESSSHPREVIEHALAHQLKDKAEASYARGTLFEKRRVLMNDWADYCDRAQMPGDVIQLRHAR